MFVKSSVKSLLLFQCVAKINCRLFQQSSPCMILTLRPFRNISRLPLNYLVVSRFVPPIHCRLQYLSTSSCIVCDPMCEMSPEPYIGWPGFLPTAENTRSRLNRHSSLQTGLMSSFQNHMEHTQFGSFGMPFVNKLKHTHDPLLMSSTRCIVCGGARQKQNQNSIYC